MRKAWFLPAVGSILVFLGALQATSSMPVRLHIQRQHSGRDCTSGQLSLEGKIVGYTLERSWENNIPLISSIPAGRYHGFVRTRTVDKWRIELTDVPNHSNIQLHVGNFVADSLGCVLVGANLTKDLCQLTESKATWDKFKIAFNEAAARLGLKDTDTPVEMVIED